LSTAGGTVGAVPILLNNRGVHEESNLLWRQPDHDGAMLKQCPAEWLDSVEVSTLVNEPENNLSEVLEPLSASS
jgi:putative SOS response-associated peptidase YedK